jgi:hypothetical protein
MNSFFAHAFASAPWINPTMIGRRERFSFRRLVFSGLNCICLAFFAADLEQLCTGHWLIEHFLDYFVTAAFIILGWPRLLEVAGCLAV